MKGCEPLLETQSDFEVIAECANGEEACGVAPQSSNPISSYLYLEMPVMDGVETIRRLYQSSLPQQPRVIVFTAFDDELVSSMRYKQAQMAIC